MYIVHITSPCTPLLEISWWRHQMETFSALLAICAGNSPVSGDFPAQRPVTRSFDVFFDLCPNKRLSKQSWGWWFETQSGSLWRHSNVLYLQDVIYIWNIASTFQFCILCFGGIDLWINHTCLIINLMIECFGARNIYSDNFMDCSWGTLYYFLYL